MKKKIFPGKTAITGGVFTAAICLAMNFYLIPQIEAETNGIRCFDMNFGYTPETARLFLSLIGEKGRFIYLHRQLPLDFVYPVFYTLLFVSLICHLCKNKKLLKAFLVLPLLLALADYAENIMSVIMLKSGVPSDAFARAASCITAVKTVLMYLIILIIIILLVKHLISRKGEKKNADA